ncbi:MAG: alanine--tRNA ligase [Acutalibacteraceae bacterium]|nr:alanine--tRNA ligase [Acutalibacteraceae bacterium]
MEWTGLNELREKYLSFFESKGHLRLPSYSLVPQGDKSLLLINSGMAPMKKFFTGEVEPPRHRVTTCQKCIRTPDIDEVGHTDRHGTYFEMLGNFSFGDYFKHEAIPWAWEFLTKELEIPEDKLYCSVYLDDDEAYDIWTKEIGVPEDHMVRLGKEDNFWEHGEGPCGPCSEIYYDRGEEYGCGKPTCGVGCECDRYMEIWNIVFSQFVNDGNGNYTPMDHPNIDTGMGLERLACVMQNVGNLFEVDTVQNIMKTVCDIADVKYHEDEKVDVSLRVITDHVRSVTFMIGDGILPSNSGRGYVLRRLLRRAARHGRILGIDRPFLTEVAEMVIHENADHYSNLVDKHDFIMNVIRAEEESFNKTIDTGTEVLDKMIAGADSRVLSGEDAFKLADTFGFPIELTQEIAAEKGMDVDLEKFQQLTAEARARAKADAAQKDVAEAWKGKEDVTKDLPATVFEGYEKNVTEGKILAIVKDGELVDSADIDEEVILVLDRTTFYAESGGQVGDVGVIENGAFSFEVQNTVKSPTGVFLHVGSATAGLVKVGETVTTSIDVETRHDTMRNHTAAHLLQAALREVLGTHVEQAGQLVDPNYVRFDFTHFSAMTGEELQKVEDRVNEVILSDIPVVTRVMKKEEAQKLGAMMLFGEKYGDMVRVVNAGDFSVEFCGGTHADSTGKLGLFKIVSENSVASGVRRIEAVTGRNVLKYIDEKNKLIGDTAAALKVGNVNDIATKAASVSAELKDAEKEIRAFHDKMAEMSAKEMMSGGVDIDGLKLVVSKVEAAGGEVRKLADKAKEQGENTIAVLAGEANGKVTFACACGKDAIAKGANAGSIVREVAKLCGGNGGGRPDSAMAGGKDTSKIDEALAAVEGIVRGMLK